VFHQLLRNEAFVDVTLACNDSSLKAHKVHYLNTVSTFPYNEYLHYVWFTETIPFVRSVALEVSHILMQNRAVSMLAVRWEDVMPCSLVGNSQEPGASTFFNSTAGYQSPQNK
jgi:hypothetical protein